MTPYFDGQLITRILSAAECPDGRQLYELKQDFRYFSEILSDIHVPAGLITDFASIPRLAFQYLDPEDPVILFPSVVHDFLYSMHGKLPTGMAYTREQADQVLREAMDLCGARWDQKAIVFRAVRLFGKSHWDI